MITTAPLLKKSQSTKMEKYILGMGEERLVGEGGGENGRKMGRLRDCSPLNNYNQPTMVSQVDAAYNGEAGGEGREGGESKKLTSRKAGGGNNNQNGDALMLKKFNK
jgi:hypothetical protein